MSQLEGSQQALKPYLINIINGINSNDSLETYIACIQLSNYIKKHFPQLKGLQEISELFKKIRIDCGITIHNYEFSEALLEACGEIKRGSTEALTEEDNKATIQLLKTKAEQAQSAIIGLSACIALIMDAQTYKDETRNMSGKQFEDRITAVKADIDTIIKPEVFEWASDPALMQQAIDKFIEHLQEYQSKLPSQDRTGIQEKKHIAVSTALSSLKKDNITAQKLSTILSTLDQGNKDAEKFTNVFHLIWKALFGSSTRLGQRINEFKAALDTIKSTPSSQSPDTTSDSNDFNSTF